MTSRQLGIAGFFLTAAGLIGGAAMILTSQSVQYGRLLSTVEQTAKDVTDIKTTLKELAPPTIKHAGTPDAPPPPSPAALVAQPAPPADDGPAEPAPDWHRAYVRDHCRLCPSCCASAATGEP